MVRWQRYLSRPLSPAIERQVIWRAGLLRYGLRSERQAWKRSQIYWNKRRIQKICLQIPQYQRDKVMVPLNKTLYFLAELASGWVFFRDPESRSGNLGSGFFIMGLIEKSRNPVIGIGIWKNPESKIGIPRAESRKLKISGIGIWIRKSRKIFNFGIFIPRTGIFSSDGLSRQKPSLLLRLIRDGVLAEYPIWFTQKIPVYYGRSRLSNNFYSKDLKAIQEFWAFFNFNLDS